MHRVLDTPADVGEFVRLLGNLRLPVTVEWVQGRDRTLDQNALQFLWATEVARQLGDREPLDVQHDWKLRHGVPILRADSAKFREVYDRLLKHRPHEEKLAAMQFISITSIMKVRQMVRYLDAVQRECLANGLRLTEPDPSLSKYHDRYRVTA